MGYAITFAVIGLLAAAVSAQPPDAACPAASPLPPELSGWAQRGAEMSGKLVIGEAVDVVLKPERDARLSVAPERAAKEDSHAGLLTFDAAEAGTYRVALGAGGWIDVLEDGKPVASTAHGHGPVCSGIRKIVDFPLKAGPHALQISGSAESRITLMLTRRP